MESETNNNTYYGVVIPFATEKEANDVKKKIQKLTGYDCRLSTFNWHSAG